MISRRNLLIAGAAVPFLSYARIPAFAATLTAFATVLGIS